MNEMKWNGTCKSRSPKKKKKKKFQSLKCFSRSWKLVNPANRQLTVWFSKRFLERTQQEHHHFDNVLHMMSVPYKKTSFPLERAQQWITESSTLPLSTLWPNFNPNKYGQKSKGLAMWFLWPYYIHVFWI